MGTDGSATAARAVDRAVEVAAASRAPLTLLCVGRPDRAKAVVEAEAARHARAGVDIRTEIADGDPAGAIMDHAQAGGYDLLVVGNKGMTGPSRFLVASVPNKISHQVPPALLIVRTT